MGGCASGLPPLPIATGVMATGGPPAAHPGGLGDECLNEHWFTTLPHARAVIEEWRRDHNERRPKKQLGGLPPAVYAARMAAQLNGADSNTNCY